MGNFFGEKIESDIAASSLWIL